MVVLWSDASVESAWVQDEAAEGRDTGRLVPVTLGGVPPAARLSPVPFDRPWPMGRPRRPADPGRGDRGDRQDREQRSTALRQPRPKPRRATHKASVCVLPFVNMSGDPEQEYFSDGITEDIITDLSKVSALSVVARNTAFTFKGQVDRREGSRARAGRHPCARRQRAQGRRPGPDHRPADRRGDRRPSWADRYDRDLTDIFAIQDEISKAIVAALRVKLLPEEKKAIETRGTDERRRLQPLPDGPAAMDQRQATATSAATRPSCGSASRRLSFDPDYAAGLGADGACPIAAALLAWQGRRRAACGRTGAGDQSQSCRGPLREGALSRSRASRTRQNGRSERRFGSIPNSWEVNREAARLHVPPRADRTPSPISRKRPR